MYQIVETLVTPAMLPILLYSKPLPSNRITPLIGSFLLGTAMTYTPTDGLKRGHEATSRMDGERDKRNTSDQLRIKGSMMRRQ